LVLIDISYLRPDHLSCYGYRKKTSPFIDRLANQGVRFDNAVAASTQTDWSIASILTSTWHDISLPTNYGNRTDSVLQFQTIADFLKYYGYQTAGFTGLGDVDSFYPFAMTGFDELKSGFETLEPRQRKTIDDWLAGLKQDRPFFLFLQTCELCEPYLPPRQYVSILDPSLKPQDLPRDLKINKARSKVASRYRNFSPEFVPDPAKMTPQEIQNLISFYDAEIRYADDMLKNLFQALRQRNLLGDNTLVIITSDHGTGFGEHGAFLNNGLHYEIAKVPLILYWPNHLPAGKVIRGTVRQVDILPTVFDFFNLEVPAQAEGGQFEHRHNRTGYGRPYFNHGFQLAENDRDNF